MQAVLDQLNADIGTTPPPKGPGVNYLNRVKNQIYNEDATEGYERLCRELALPEDKAASGQVCAKATPSYGKIGAVTAAVAVVVLAVVWEVWGQ